ncbi:MULTISPECIES: Mlp family lipoprotein [Borreliella]|uniref:Uncharacterized protein n=1 Tax=Borreliella spielmanii TaxID=88916 RepID=A0ABR6P7L2_9SPIR|nr:Mlp family lipoprotein [Borreliella spielmanii]MBB6032018.1 hypothetical protein [Borreliella spielmanii]
MANDRKFNKFLQYDESKIKPTLDHINKGLDKYTERQCR